MFSFLLFFACQLLGTFFGIVGFRVCRIVFFVKVGQQTSKRKWKQLNEQRNKQFAGKTKSWQSRSSCFGFAAGRSFAERSNGNKPGRKIQVKLLIVSSQLHWQCYQGVDVFFIPGLGERRGQNETQNEAKQKPESPASTPSWVRALTGRTGQLAENNDKEERAELMVRCAASLFFETLIFCKKAGGVGVMSIKFVQVQMMNASGSG